MNGKHAVLTIMLFFTLLLTNNTSAQQQVTEFPIGVFSGALGSDTITSIKTELGANLVVHTTYWTKKDELSIFKYLIPLNPWSATDYIYHFSSGMHTMWEAEEQVIPEQIGMKSEFGSAGQDGNVGYWFSGNNTANANRYLLKGPNYRQLIKYDLDYEKNLIHYFLKISMKLGTQLSSFNLDPSQVQVCKILVTANNGSNIINEVIITADYLSTTQYKDTIFTYNLSSLAQQASAPAFSPGPRGSRLQEKSNIVDGIEFKIQWLGTWGLYVDNIELKHDQGIWQRFEQGGADSITLQISNFIPFQNIYYWYTKDEPGVDRYEPHKMVNNAVANSTNNQSHAITTFLSYDNATYGYDDIYIPQFVNKAQPAKLMVDVYPIRNGVNNITGQWYTDSLLQEYAKLRRICNTSNECSPGYYFVGQAYYRDSVGEPNRRMPTKTEFTGQGMLALSHGAKGLIYWKYKTQTNDKYIGFDSDTSLINAFTTLAARLIGSLGNTLLSLQHDSSDYLRAHWGTYEGNQTTANFSNYLTLQKSDQSSKGSFHCGVFYDSLDITNNKYYLLLNELTLSGQSTNIGVTVNRPNQNYINWRWKNIEGGFDETITGQTTRYFDIPLGQGYLYQLAPVVKYGGTIKSSETITGTNELKAAMTIASGATLNVNGTYNIYGNITVNSGGAIVLAQGAKLNFLNGSSLIVNGILASNGITTNKVTFDFISKSYTAQNGIKVNSGASLYVSNSIIKHGWYGIYCNNTYTSSIISNWEIDSCNTGIYFNGTNIGISNNYIHDNWMGIALYNSSPTLTQNKLTGNTNYAVSSSGATSIPKFGSSGTQGKNKITGNSVGVCAFSSSLPMLGNNSPLNGGYNTFGENTSYNVYAITSGIIFAINNYWGNILPAPPISSKIWISNGVILYSPYLSSDPTGLNKVAPLAEDAELVLLKKAMDLMEQNDFAAARGICLDIIDNYSDSYAAYNALSLLTQTYDSNEKETTKLKFKTLFNREKKKLNAVAGLILAEVDNENKLKNIDEVISKYKGDAVIEDALFAKFLYYYNDIHDKENARLVSNELDKLFPNSVSNIVAHQHLGDKDYLQKEYSFAKTNQEQKQNVVTSPIPVEYNLFANYPNPFNPATVIKYALPYASNVNITVYNTLGQIVKEYFEGTKEAGYYSVNFTGENLSSGVYLYSINAVSANGRQNFNATKKMLLLK